MFQIENITTLVIEANGGMRSQLRDMLALTGITKVQFAVAAGAAVRKLRDNVFDLILCEYHLGAGQDGQHLLEDLRHNRIIPLETLFIMVTGERQYERVVGAAELAPSDYILKPFTPDALLARIRRSLVKREAFIPAYQAVAKDDLRGAIIYCREGETKFPPYLMDFLRLRGQLHLEIGEIDEAQTVYQRVLEVRAVPWARLGLAKTLHLQKRYDEAEEILAALVAENDTFLDAYDWLARNRNAAGTPQSAREALAVAVARSPHRINRLRQYGEACLAVGDHDGAERSMAEVVRKSKYSDFRDPEDHLRLVQAQLASGNLDRAEETIRDLDKSMAGLKKTRMCKALTAALYHGQTGNVDMAQAALRTALASSQEEHELSQGLRGELAKACFSLDMEEEATSVVMDMMRNATDANSIDAARKLLESQGKENLVAEVDRRLQAEVKTLMAAGVEKAQSGDFDGAVAEMMNAVRKMPGNIHVLFNAALAVLRHIEHRGWNDGLASEARSLIDRARRLDSTHPRLAALTEFLQGLHTKYGIRAA